MIESRPCTGFSLPYIRIEDILYTCFPLLGQCSSGINVIRRELRIYFRASIHPLGYDYRKMFTSDIADGFALLYVLSPLDLVPDSFPLLGKIDDAYAILVSVAKLLRSTDRNIILRHWLGDPETIDTVRAWLNYFDEKLGSGLMKKIAGMIKRA